MPCHRVETHHLKDLSERLGSGGAVLDELDAVETDRVGNITEHGQKRLTRIGLFDQKIAHTSSFCAQMYLIWAT